MRACPIGETGVASDIGAAYLAAASHTYGGADGEGDAAPGAFAARVAAADLLIHVSDDPARDLLEGAGGRSLRRRVRRRRGDAREQPDLVMLDMTDPRRPRARPLSDALARIVRARAINPRFIAGQMRHGPRGAAELAETVDRLVDFAETTGAVPSELLDLVHDAYLADPEVREFLMLENPAAARAIAERLDTARRLGLWHPRRNDIDASLASFARRPPNERPRWTPMRRLRRGACPGLSAPMATGDGLFARLTPAGSTIALDAFAGLCAAARTARQRHRRDHLTRQHPDPGLELRRRRRCLRPMWRRCASKAATAFRC